MIFVGFLCSTLVDRKTYLGFFVNWFIEMVSVVGYFTFFTTAGLLYICFYLYLNGMVQDLSMQMTEDNGQLDELAQTNEIGTVNASLNFVRAIQFHNDILE